MWYLLLPISCKQVNRYKNCIQNMYIKLYIMWYGQFSKHNTLVWVQTNQQSMWGLHLNSRKMVLPLFSDTNHCVSWKVRHFLRLYSSEIVCQFASQQCVYINWKIQLREKIWINARKFPLNDFYDFRADLALQETIITSTKTM